MKKVAAHQVALVFQLTDFALQLCHFQYDLMTAESDLMTAESELVRTAESELQMTAESALVMTAESELVMTAESELMINTEFELNMTAELELKMTAGPELMRLADSVQGRAHEPALHVVHHQHCLHLRWAVGLLMGGQLLSWMPSLCKLSAIAGRSIPSLESEPAVLGPNDHLYSGS